MTSSRPAILAVGAAAALAAAGCGSSSDSSSSDTASTAAPATTTAAAPAAGAESVLALKADASGALKFDTTKLAAKAGTVRIVMDNPSSVPHAIALEGNGIDKDGKTVTSGGQSVVSATLKPGTYTFYCPVPGHEAGGMKGTLTVT
jgi:plastocyanin